MRQLFASLTVVAALGAGEGSGFRIQGSEPSGQELVAQAARKLQAQGSLAAELRYRIDAYGQQLVGAGTYRQLAVGNERWLKLELQTRVGNRPAVLQEIRNHDFYCVRRDVPPQPPALWRVNLRQLGDAAGHSSGESNAQAVQPELWMMLGGLPQLVASLSQNFAFDAAQQDSLPFRGADGQSVERLPVWKIIGRWKPERLSAVIGRDASKHPEIPEQLPERVELLLARGDGLPPLFPCRITYWQPAKKGKKPSTSDSASAPRELLTLELFHINTQAALAQSEFDFNPGELDVEDRTARYIQRLSGGAKLR